MERMTAAGVTNLRLKYPGSGSLLFKELSFSVRQGEKVLLLGPSGCGKSTLLQVLSGIVPDIVELPMKADAVTAPERPGVVFQDPDTQFCMPYADEEIAFVLENQGIPREEMPARIRRVLDRVGLRLPDLHTPIGQFSQGMKQRLAIAGVLALAPDVWFLDEPTALLDEEGTRQIWQMLREVTVGQTVVIVEHKIDGILDFVDRVVVFAPDGVILADGPAEEVFRTQREALAEFGIWYPGVWDDYFGGGWNGGERAALSGASSDRETGERVLSSGASSDRETAERLPLTAAGADLDAPAQAGAPHLELCGLEGIRGGEMKIAAGDRALQAGEWIAVVGPNGSGKSSLLLAIMRLIRTRGETRIGGAALKKVEALARHIAFVFQNPEFQFVTNSVEEEMAYSLPEEAASPAGGRIAAVGELLARYDLTELRTRHPFQLSTGQKRRLSVAAALSGGQRIVLLDEPTFGLDARNTFLLLERLEKLRREGTAILMVTHDPEIVRRFATRVWQVTNGRIAELEPEASESRQPAEKEAQAVCN